MGALVACLAVACAASTPGDPESAPTGEASAGRAVDLDDAAESTAEPLPAGEATAPSAGVERAEPEPPTVEDVEPAAAEGGAASEGEGDGEGEGEGAVAFAAEEAVTANGVSAGDAPCCGDDACVQACETPADCPRCRPACSRSDDGQVCSVPVREGRAECHRDADCVLVSGSLPCQVCGSCPGSPAAWSRRAWNRAVREARRECSRRRDRRHRPRCAPCPEPRPVYVPTEAICSEGQCVPHGGRVVMPEEDPLRWL